LNRDSLISLYDRLARLVDKLPGGLQKPILRELEPIREVFLEQRVPRLMLAGDAALPAREALAQALGIVAEPGLADNGWRLYEVPHRGAVEVLDARAGTPDSLIAASLDRRLPDVIVFLREPGGSGAADARFPVGIPVVGVALGGDEDRTRMAALLTGHPELAGREIATAVGAGKSAEAVCKVLPGSARLEFARASGARKAQAQIASSLLASFTAVCGVIALQPIPLADLPVLTALQMLMVGLIIHVSGRDVTPRLAAEFLGALGLNVGAAILFREGARAVIKVVPFWGNTVSGVIAGAGTYAIGRAAISYFVEETPLTEARKLFRRMLPGRNKKLLAPPPLPLEDRKP